MEWNNEMLKQKLSKMNSNIEESLIVADESQKIDLHMYIKKVNS